MSARTSPRLELGDASKGFERRLPGRVPAAPSRGERTGSRDGTSELPSPRRPSRSRDAGREPMDLRAIAPGGSTRRMEELAVRFVNLLVAAVALVALLPVFALIALLIKLDSPGPVFYRQLRVGLDRRGGIDDLQGGRRTGDIGGRPFVIYKFRTMKVDAEDETGPVWSRLDDDRTTRIGRVLRRHRLDELPQLWNVLVGDMSIVGPRPERPGFVRDLRQDLEGYRHRHRVRPGITGLAQVHRDNDQSVDDVRRKLEYDLEYLRRRSLLLDLRIMARTPLVMLRRDLVDGQDDAGDGKGADDA